MHPQNEDSTLDQSETVSVFYCCKTCSIDMDVARLKKGRCDNCKDSFCSIVCFGHKDHKKQCMKKFKKSQSPSGTMGAADYDCSILLQQSSTPMQPTISTSKARRDRSVSPLKTRPATTSACD